MYMYYPLQPVLGMYVGTVRSTEYSQCGMYLHCKCSYPYILLISMYLHIILYKLSSQGINIFWSISVQGHRLRTCICVESQI